MDFCWDPWQVSALACPPVWSGTADTAAPPSTGPSLGTESCQPWGRGGLMKTVAWDGPMAVGRITLALSTAQGPWGGWVMRMVGRADVLGRSPPPAHPSPSRRGASRPPMATCPTLDPAPATTTWQPWPPRPLWVGTSCSLLEFALSTPDTSCRGARMNCSWKDCGTVESSFPQCQAPSWAPQEEVT